MTERELLKLAREHGYQLVPLPEVIDHDLRPGDEVIEILPPGIENLTKQALGTERANSLFNFGPQRGVILAVASRADVMIRRNDGRIVFVTAKGLAGEPRVRKVAP